MPQVRQDIEFDFDHQNIEDRQLAMIFAVCRPGNSTESQVYLALQILCGFSVEEIANAFLPKTETIKKRLQRARDQFRKEGFGIKKLNASEIQQLLDTILTTLYLLFNEGYFSETDNQVIKKDFCSEAIRLILVLTNNPFTNPIRCLLCWL